MSRSITGVGSLPHTDPAEAARFVTATTDVAYLAQLPSRHGEEGMLRQWGDGMCGCGAVDSGYGLAYGAPPGPRHEAFVGAGNVLDAMTGSMLKTQATGPVTLAAAMLAAGHPGTGLWPCVVATLNGRIADHVRWIEERRPGLDVLLVLDEPALTAVTGAEGFPIRPGDAVAGLREVVAASPVPTGLHCCGETDWGLVASLEPAVISWDVTTLARGLDDAEPVAAAIAAGTRIIWGVAPSVPLPVSGSTGVLGALATATTRLIVAGAPAAALIEDAWFSPACGLAGVSVEQAAWVMAEVAKVVAVMAT